jgi:hypothetical protein
LKRIVYLLAAGLSIIGPARAQSTDGGGLVLGNAPAAPGAQTCVQVNVIGQKPLPYNCLNQQLQQQVQTAAPAPPVPLGANSPANAAGAFNRAGVAEQYGANFGNSVIPYRPAAPGFSGVGP